MSRPWQNAHIASGATCQRLTREDGGKLSLAVVFTMYVPCSLYWNAYFRGRFGKCWALDLVHGRLLYIPLELLRPI